MARVRSPIAEPLRFSTARFPATARFRDPSNPYGSYDTGAGIFTDNGGYILRSTINGNYTDGTGGGIATHGPLIVANSTISGNTATKKSGGGIFARDVAMSIVSSTIASNAAARGGGVYGGGLPRFRFRRRAAEFDRCEQFVSSGFADIAARAATVVSGLQQSGCRCAGRSASGRHAREPIRSFCRWDSTAVRRQRTVIAAQPGA